MNENLIHIRVWGDWACFTRPEMKVERVSYPLMTPSAARGILEAIFWEPQMFYVTDSIRVVRRGQWVSFRRNEVTSRISIRNTQQWMNGEKEVTPIQAGGGAEDGTQRNTLALEKVEYIISAEIHLTELGCKAGQNLQKYKAEIMRRAQNGKCFHRPSLGVREFAADFEWEEDAQTALERRTAELDDGFKNWKDESLGLMLYDLFDQQGRAIGFRWLNDEELSALPQATQRKRIRDPLAATEGLLVKPIASFFHAHIKDSVVDCHPSRINVISWKGGQD